MEFLAFGVTKGYTSMKCSSDQDRFLSSFYREDSGRKMRISKLPSGEVYYTYLVYPQKNEKFCDSDGRGGAFFGMSIVLKNQYCRDANKVYDLFESFYNKAVKNTIIKEDEKGNKRFQISDFSANNVENYMTQVITKMLVNDYDIRKDLVDFKFNQRENRCYNVNVLDANGLIDAQMRSPYDIEISRNVPQMQNINTLKSQRS